MYFRPPFIVHLSPCPVLSSPYSHIHIKERNCIVFLAKEGLWAEKFLFIENIYFVYKLQIMKITTNTIEKLYEILLCSLTVSYMYMYVLKQKLLLNKCLS